jgi:hypothetical protein
LLSLSGWINHGDDSGLNKANGSTCHLSGILQLILHMDHGSKPYSTQTLLSVDAPHRHYHLGLVETKFSIKVRDLDEREPGCHYGLKSFLLTSIAGTEVLGPSRSESCTAYH